MGVFQRVRRRDTKKPHLWSKWLQMNGRRVLSIIGPNRDHRWPGGHGNPWPRSCLHCTGAFHRDLEEMSCGRGDLERATNGLTTLNVAWSEWEGESVWWKRWTFTQRVYGLHSPPITHHMREHTGSSTELTTQTPLICDLPSLNL